MAGTLSVIESASWMPAGWVFGNVVEAIAERIEPEFPDFARDLRISVEEAGMMFDLWLLKNAEFNVFRNAAAEVRECFQNRGPSEFADPTFFPGFMARFDELLAMLSNAATLRANESRSARTVDPIIEFDGLGIPINWETIRVGWDGLRVRNHWSVVPIFPSQFRGIEIVDHAKRRLAAGAAVDSALVELAHEDPTDSKQIDRHLAAR